MFGWIRASHEAQVQSPAVLGLGQVEMTLQQHANFVKPGLWHFRVHKHMCHAQHI